LCQKFDLGKIEKLYQKFWEFFQILAWEFFHHTSANIFGKPLHEAKSQVVFGLDISKYPTLNRVYKIHHEQWDVFEDQMSSEYVVNEIFTSGISISWWVN